MGVDGRFIRHPVLLLAGVAIAALAGACNNGVTDMERHYQQLADQHKSDLDRCMQELGDRDAQISLLRRQIEDQQSFQGIDFNDLFVVDHIELAKRTGGIDIDGQPGDDGVVVYLRTLDSDGDAIKAAGQITVQLFDLANGKKPRTLATYIFDDQNTLRKSWYGGFLSNHYTFKCPFKPNAAGQPETREVQVRVTFLDWLTGRSFATSKAVEIDRIDRENSLRPG